MKSMLDILMWVVGLAAAIFAIYEYYLFATYKGTTGTFDMQGGQSHLWLAIAATVVALACGIIYFVRHVNKEEEIHITQ
jgi:heme exporter protein D